MHFTVPRVYLFVDLVSIARAHPGQERDPRGELPFHLDVKVRSVLQLLQEVRDPSHPAGVPLAVSSLKDNLIQKLKLSCDASSAFRLFPYL